MPPAFARPTALEFELAEYLRSFDPRIDELNAHLGRDGYIELPEFAPPGLRGKVVAEVHHMLDCFSRRRELHIEATGGSPRYYENVSRNDIFAHTDAIPQIYRSSALRTFLATLTGEPAIVPVPYEPEEIVITRMTQPGDSHGWHWDDYSYSLIWMIQAPALEEGASLEYVRDTTWDKDAPKIDEYLEARTIERRHPATHSLYLLKADTAMHRVAPLKVEGATRIILCFSYATLADLDRTVTHETMETLYPVDDDSSAGAA